MRKSTDYPQWWNTTITIYNRHIDSITDLITWYRHHIDFCFWKYRYDEIKLGSSVIISKNCICRIPEDDIYLPIVEWNKLGNDQRENYFTLKQGDIIVNGKVDDIIDEYGVKQTANDLITKYTIDEPIGCMTIDNVIINVGGGRNNPHYHVRGQ